MNITEAIETRRSVKHFDPKATQPAWPRGGLLLDTKMVITDRFPAVTSGH